MCAQVHSALTYADDPTDVQTTRATEALRGGNRRVRRHYAHVMLAVCHVVGVRARYVSGHLVGDGGSDVWVEVLRPENDATYTRTGTRGI